MSHKEIADNMEFIKDWFLKLKYGKIKTPFHHYTVLLDVFAEKEVTDYNSNVCPEGNAWMGVKVWANDADEAADIACTFARSIGLEINTSIVYKYLILSQKCLHRKNLLHMIVISLRMMNNCKTGLKLAPTIIRL